MKNALWMLLITAIILDTALFFYAIYRGIWTGDHLSWQLLCTSIPTGILLILGIYLFKDLKN